ncbi:hypothetical protein [Bacillus sp. SD088]|uniref:hypothetical protein n=1 Tax=Bacillus sp. SD088 TaxID=2782012 RepID=UPI001A95EE1B|nr:hypothetical protein [Bacillus sp. SD088]MBO0995990.1 hypothetical protein [Bacillus sp. SD088]
MLIANNIIKNHFQNIYFITGGPCGGKTTVSKYLAKKYDMILYNWDEHFPDYQAVSTPEYQPALCSRTTFESWEEYFMRPVEEFAEWGKKSFEEQTGMVVADLLRISGSSGNKKILVDGFFSVNILKEISDYTRVVFLIASEEVVRHYYFNREDKRDMFECIKGLKDPEAAFENTFRSMFYKAEENEYDIQNSGFKYFKRETMGTNPNDLINQVEEHFGFNKKV